MFPFFLIFSYLKKKKRNVYGGGLYKSLPQSLISDDSWTSTTGIEKKTRLQFAESVLKRLVKTNENVNTNLPEIKSLR